MDGYRQHPSVALLPEKREFLEGAVQPLTAQLATPIKPSVLDVIAEGDKVAVQWDGPASALLLGDAVGEWQGARGDRLS